MEDAEPPMGRDRVIWLSSMRRLSSITSSSSMRQTGATMSKGKWGIAAVLVAVLPLGCAATGDTSAPAAAGSTAPLQPAPEPTVDGGQPVVMTAEDVVDVMGPAALRFFCKKDMTFKAFKSGYGNPPDPSPSAEDVFDELASRC
jgi:hypothetical protein